MMILASLADGPRHGYSITRRIQQTSDGVLEVEEGSLYPALHRLAKREWVEAEWKLSENNRRAKFYRLTPKGRKRLKADREAWGVMARAIGQVLSAKPLSRGATA